MRWCLRNPYLVHYDVQHSPSASNMTTVVTILKRVARVVFEFRRCLEVNSRSNFSQVNARQGHCIASRTNMTAVTIAVV